MSKIKESYLRCRVYPGAFQDEYVVEFNSLSNKPGECFVNREDVKDINGNDGLVKLISCELGNDKAYVGINNIGNHMISFFLMPTSEVKT